MNNTIPGDGGPAFPVPGLHNDQDFNGMSLRDYAAIHTKIGDFLVAAAEALLGRPCPGPENGAPVDPITLITYWSDADAAMRYLSADSMLRARRP